MFDDRDLDDLLSGQLADIPPPLRQVADALSALCAAPAPSELDGEAAAMAEFSAFARSRGPAHTLVLSAPPPDVARKPRARHRGSRGVGGFRSVRGVRPPKWRAGALTGVASAAVIVMIVAFGGFLPGPIKDITAHLSISSLTATHHAAGASGSRSVAPRSPRSAAPVRPTVTPSHLALARPATTAPPDGRTLCRTWFADFGHPLPYWKWHAQRVLFGEISKLAGGPERVFPYCAPYVKDMLPRGYPWFHDGPGGPHANGPGSGISTRRF